MEVIRACSFESRRSREMEALLRKLGAEPTVAPSMREIPLDENSVALDFAARLLAGEIDAVVLLTGVGTRALMDVATTRYERDEMLAALDRTFVAIRGPKPAAVLKEWGTHVDVRAPEPNTWEELVAALDASGVALAGRNVAVQEYGVPNAAFYQELERRGATVLPVPVYRWAFPEDTGPLLAAVRGVVEGEFDVLLFTSAHQVTNVLRAAGEKGIEESFRWAAAGLTIASVGPTCSDALREAGLPVSVEASPPKMGPLVKAAVETARAAVTGE